MVAHRTNRVPAGRPFTPHDTAIIPAPGIGPPPPPPSKHTTIARGGHIQQYLPFVLREFVVAELDDAPNPAIPVFPATKTVVRVASSEIGFERPVHLGDIAISARPQDTQEFPQASRLMMRVGWRGRGYILERPIQIGAWINAGRALTNCWRLEKPYYLPANGHMKVVLQAYDTNSAIFRGIVFSCTREDNGEPYYLYESTDTAINSTTSPRAGLRKQHLKAPPDTGLFIHSVGVPDFDVTGELLTNLSVKITSPNGYEWVKVVDRSNLAALVPLYYQQWLGPPTSLIRLGSERGWIIQPKESLLIEFENRSQDEIALAITIRGSVEV